VLAEQALLSCFQCLDKLAAMISPDGSASTGSPVAGEASQRKAFVKALGTASDQFQACQLAWQAWERAEKEALSGQALVADVEKNASELYPAALSHASEEAQRLDGLVEKAAAKHRAARETATNAMARVKEVCSSFVEGFYRSSEGIAQNQVKASQTTGLASCRQLMTSWTAWKSGVDSWAKSMAAHKKHLGKSFALSLAQTHQEKAWEIAHKEHEAATKDRQTSAASKEALEKELESLAKRLAEAEEGAAEAKRKRTELRSKIAEAKKDLKSAKAAETAASASRSALHQSCWGSGGGEGVRGAPKKRGRAAAKKKATRGPKAKKEGAQDEPTSLESATALQAKRAAEALTTEQYNVHQVAEAYEQARKKQKVEVDME